jgi:hypothetical protein
VIRNLCDLVILRRAPGRALAEAKEANQLRAAVSGALTLKIAGDFPGADWHVETNRPPARLS